MAFVVPTRPACGHLTRVRPDDADGPAAAGLLIIVAAFGAPPAG